MNTVKTINFSKFANQKFFYNFYSFVVTTSGVTPWGVLIFAFCECGAYVYGILKIKSQFSQFLLAIPTERLCNPFNPLSAYGLITPFIFL
jgi:hypothetical protein